MGKTESLPAGKPDCFVIMPISDPEGYKHGHFFEVFQDIIKVASEKAGYNAIRADDVKQTNLIHLDILNKLIETPMAICDLSDRNPNVLFELGLRQAFDKPTVLIQECGTNQIFDIAPLRITEYRKELGYREVLEDQNKITEALIATKKATDDGNGVNSLIRLLSLSSPAILKPIKETDTMLMLNAIMQEIDGLRWSIKNELNINKDRRIDSRFRKFENINMKLDKFKRMIINGVDKNEIQNIYWDLENSIENQIIHSHSIEEKEYFNKKIKDIKFIYSSYIDSVNKLRTQSDFVEEIRH